MVWVESKPAEISCDVDRSVPRSKHLGFLESICSALYYSLHTSACTVQVTLPNPCQSHAPRRRNWAQPQTCYLPIWCFLKRSIFFYILETKKQNKTFSLINLPEPYGNSEKSSSVS